MIYKELKILDFKTYESSILALLVETYVVNFGIPKDEAQILCSEKIIALEKYTQNGSAILIGSIKDNELRGIVWAYIHEYFSETRLHINQIAVEEKYRGKAIGKRLVSEVEKKAIDLNISTIDLFVSETNEGALALYDGLGFNTERRYMKKVLKESKK